MHASTTGTSAIALDPGAVTTPPIEHQIYMRSPCGTGLTSAFLFLFFYGSFLTVAWADGVAVVTRTSSGLRFTAAGWPGLVLSLLCVAAMGMQRFARLREAADLDAWSRILAGGMASASRITGIAASEARLVRATITGFLVGIAIAAIVLVVEAREGHAMPLSTQSWFAAATILISVLFARGVEQTRAGNRAYAAILENELKIDLLRIDLLAVLGRSAARGALVWFVVSAVACLFIVDGDLKGLTAAMIASSAAMGILLFTSSMLRIHRLIRTRKEVEIEHVRSQIETLRAKLLEDDHAATRLHGVIAYEKRISDAPEWPFDQSTLVRLGASALIVTVPWFGQAAVQYLIDQIAR
jgi:hypothetical protein